MGGTIGVELEAGLETGIGAGLGAEVTTGFILDKFRRGGIETIEKVAGLSVVFDLTEDKLF